MYLVVGYLVWWAIGYFGFRFWWTREIPWSMADDDKWVIPGILGPLTWVFGYFIHGRSKK